MARSAPVSRRFLVGVSLAAMASGLSMPASAQLARLRSGAGTGPVPTAASVPSIPLRPATMREAQARAQALQSRADQIRGYVTSARDAALASTRTNPTDGLSSNGLDPIAAIREAASLTAAGGAENIARAQALLASASATRDASGAATWEGASAPVQSIADGKTQVTITQNQSRALLSWNRFDVGKNTSLNFVQQQAGVAQTGWTVVNRVVSSVAPSTILGSVKADGTVLVLNRNGVIFGQGAQVNLGSLLVSTLEIGNYGRNFRDIQLDDGRLANVFDAITLKERNSEYIQNGLFAGARTSGTLPSLLFSPLYADGVNRTDSTPVIEGSITIDPGASLTAASGGFLIFAGPTVTNGGVLSASNGQVSLQGGRLVAATASTGATTSADANVRGLILRTIGTVTTGIERRSSAANPLDPIADDGTVVNTGLIESPRGYLSLGAGLFGSVTNAGLLASTTSVSRNGKISLTGGTVTLAGNSDAARAGAIVITPDASAETIPQGTADVPAPFKTSAIEFGARADDPDAVGSAFGLFIPSVVSLGENSLILAPSADVVIGRPGGVAFDPTLPIRTDSGFAMARGATIDVSGVKDVQVAATRNSIEITPVKRNELRDTPNYREVSLTGDFTLNGQTLFVDPRRSGVRDDGVRWVGSPLIEAGSIVSQIGVTASELMTRGGDVAIGTNLLTTAATPDFAARIAIASGATIDFGGGWVHYGEGVVRSSNLLTSDGRIVNIGDADPNDIFVSVASGFTASQPKFGSSDTFADPLLQGGRVEAAYDEGRDAGSLVIGGSAITVDGSLYGDAFAGVRQTANAVTPSVAATLAQDKRLLQRTAQDLPSGGFLRIGSLTGASGVALGGDISVYRGTTSSVTQDGSTVLLSDVMLSRAGLSALTLQTSGGISFATGSSLTLAAGGALTVDAGRGIIFDGSIFAASGSISARTYELARAPIAEGSITALGSAFRDDDDLTNIYSVGSSLPHPFDITVTGTLSTAGRWVNDYATTEQSIGRSYLDGGSISLTVAPKVFVALGETLVTAEDAGDLSGRLTIASGALLDVSSGGYVAPDRTLDLTAIGGSIALINETTYAGTVVTVPPVAEGAGRSDSPIAGSNQTVDFTPGDSIVPGLVPGAPQATVTFDTASLKGFGFTGGGTLTIVSPDVTFGSDQRAGSTHLGFDLFVRTGFGTLDVTAFHSRILPDLFTNERAGNSAFFDTTTLRVGAGETFDLTQSLLPRFLSSADAGALLSLVSGSRVTTVLTPGFPVSPFDQVAANLTLRGLTELDVAEGGRIVGAQEATIVAPKILNQGSIVLPGGSLIQRDFLPINLALRGLGIRDDNSLRGLITVFGPRRRAGRFDENAPNEAGIFDPLDPTRLLTNRELFTRPDAERFIYFTGAMDIATGIRLDPGSVTDLSGVALVDTHAAYLPSGRQLLTGRIVAGGTISTATLLNPPTGNRAFSLFTNPVYGNARYFNASDNTLPPIVGVTAPRLISAFPGTVIDLSGASGMFDRPVSITEFAPALEWSDGGMLYVGGGGSIARATIDARGGAPLATGGTLEWVRPTIRQADETLFKTDVVAADQIMAAGFATVNALGGVSFDGTVSLSLAKAFTVESTPSTTGVPIATDAAIVVSANDDAVATVSAPFIRFASRLGSIPSIGAETENPTGSVTFDASSGIDFVGGTLFDSSIATVTLRTPGDVRFIGVDDRLSNSLDLPSLDGGVIAWGDLTIDAGRTYATTGTGNLQRFLEDSRKGVATTVNPFLLAALGDSAITFGHTYFNPVAPMSAGSFLRIQASQIEQNGYLAAPLGLLEIGSNIQVALGPLGPFIEPTVSLTFGTGSITTVSGANLNIPYGSTTDLTEYFFAPSVGLPLTTTPVGQLTLSGATIDVAAGATMDGRGGGDVFAFEFVSGTGGSRDVLDRFNRDAFSSNAYDATTGIGFQYADRRQVYAIVPVAKAQDLAAFDPVYSADYRAAAGGDLYGAQAGLAVTLDASAGVPAGQYLLLPAHYALMPGAYRIVENVGAPPPAPGAALTLVDGSVQVGGNFSTAGTGLAESTRRSFTLQSRDTFAKFSRIETTGATATIVKQAITQDVALPRLPIDAARIVLAPQRALEIAGLFDTTPATNGKGAQVDVLARDILIVPTLPATISPDVLTVTDDTLSRFAGNSLSIGAERSENIDGTTTLGIVANTLTVASGSYLSAPELILAVGGRRSELTIGSDSTLIATGAFDDAATGDYLVRGLLPAEIPNGYQYDATGIGAVVRLSSGGERLITRTGDAALRNTLAPSQLFLQAATLTGNSIAIDTSQRLILSDRLTFQATNLALGGDRLEFGDPGFSAPLLDALGGVDRLTLGSRGLLTFSAGDYAFNDLRIDTPGILATGEGLVSITADAVELGNSAIDLGACDSALGPDCGRNYSRLSIVSNQTTFGDGTLRAYGFGRGVTIRALEGAFVNGKGELNVGAARLALATPFIVDRSAVVDPRDQATRPDYTFLTTGEVFVTRPMGTMNGVIPQGNSTPGARIAFGSADTAIQRLFVDGAAIRATAGIIDVQARFNIGLSNGASLATPGYTRTFGDAVDAVTVSAGGGTINLASRDGSIVVRGATLSVDNGVGRAGTLNLLAGNGAITFDNFATAIQPGLTGPRDASFTFDTGRTSFDLGGFIGRYGALFGGDVAIRSGVGDLTLASGQTLRADSVRLTADGGFVTIAGTIDTAGTTLAGLSAEAARDSRVDGGDVALFGASGVTLAATALIDTHTSGYGNSDTRSASAGDVMIGIRGTDAAISFAAGARIDASATRTLAMNAAGLDGNRLIAQTVKDPVSLANTTVYRLAMADTGGNVSFRAPVVGQSGSLVDVRLGGTITGADEVSIEGFKTWNLDTIAADGRYSGVGATETGVSLNFAETRRETGMRNILTENFVGAGGQQSLVNFIQTFEIAARNGSSFAGIRLRPGVELTSTGDITLATNWNLGAGTLDEAAAIGVGLLTAIPELGERTDGKPFYAVTPGRETELFQNYVSMLYRVGGRVDGEAAVVTMRAGGVLDIAHSISDGFFSFGDRTDPTYMSYQLGGGDRTVAPAAQFACGTRFSGDCSQIISFDRAVSGLADYTADQVATISLENPLAGSDQTPGVLAPYSALANSAAALGSGRNGDGDPLGGAELFPLLEDGTRAVRSTSLRLVAGADATASADPLHVDRGTGADVLIRGEQSYRIVARAGRGTFGGDLEIRLRPNLGSGETSPVSAAPGDFIDAVAGSSNAEGLDPDVAGDYFTLLKWGENDALAETTLERATKYFALNFPAAVFRTDDRGRTTGVAAPLSVIIGFLQDYGPEYAQKVESGAFNVGRPNPAAPINLGGNGTVFAGTVVRTGDGSIDVAAARSVDLRRTEEILYRTPVNSSRALPPDAGLDPTAYQVGGTALYTAGQRVAREAITAATIDGQTIRLDWNPDATGATFDQLAYTPSAKGQYLNAPTLLTGGGDVSISAAVGDVLARRDAWAEQNLGTGSAFADRLIGDKSPIFETTFLPVGFIGATDQRWRVGQVGENTQISVVPQLFTAGVGALGGGDVSVLAGGAINDLTLALDTSVTTANPFVPTGLADGNPVTATLDTGTAAPPVLITWGAGKARVHAGNDLVAGQFDIASGIGTIAVGGDVIQGGGTARPLGNGTQQGEINALRLRVADAYVTLSATGSARIGGIGALGVRTSSDPLIQDAGLGYFSAAAGFEAITTGAVTLDATRPELRVTNFSGLFENSLGSVLPPSLSLTSLTGDVAFAGDIPRLLYPSMNGQLSLLAGGDINSLALVMSDADPSLLPGAFSVRFAAGSTGGGLDFGFNGVFPNTSDVDLRLAHNEQITHADDDTPARVYADGSITNITLSLAKQARIGAGIDILDMVYVGQNVRDGDVTRITAGRDILGTTAFSNAQRRPYVNGNTFTLGGYGTLAIEAGRNLGPLLNSATIGSGLREQSYAGGIRTVGNDRNPWLESRGADIQALFGIANGADYDALQATYLDPLNAASLDGDLFVQVTDVNGNASPDRTRPVYAPILAEWLNVNAPDALATAFGGAVPTDFAAQSYSRVSDLYAIFSRLDGLTRRTFLLDQLYFNELAQSGLPTSPSFQQYVRGYRATQTLFPTRLGYTDNLATYTTDPASVNADHPLGVPTKILLNGEPIAATRVQTGNVDLRLATIETVRGGDVTIVGPGGDVIAGSVVRTSDQAARRASLFGVEPQVALENGLLGRLNQVPISAIPIGFEGVLTLRGGAIRSFTDGDFRLNQSRLFSLAGGDIIMWSSNGDLNAGQGPRSASSFPPITVRFDQNGRAEVDSAGSVAGAGIGAFQQTPTDPLSSIILVAPVGEVDAGDAGVRASGNVFVAAARVANADNFSAGGEISGVPTGAVTTGAATPASAASSIVGNVAGLANAASNNADRLSLISVDVLGFSGGTDRCDDPKTRDATCPEPK